MYISMLSQQMPPHRFSQEELIAALQKFWAKKHANPRRLEQFHQSVQVESRYLALSKEEYENLDSFTKANNAFIRVGTEIGSEAVRSCLSELNLNPQDVDAIFFTTVTGLAVPTIDARIINKIGLRRDIKRTPLFGLGCVAGAAGLARAYDYLLAWPDHVVILLAVELCSLTIQTEDFSVPNLIATGLFGDGAVAVCLEGEKRQRRSGAGPRILATRSAFYYDTERVMGWDIGSEGFKIVLDASVPRIAKEFLPRDVDVFLAEHKLRRSDIVTWVCHPGGPKVLSAIKEGLDLKEDALELTWRSLAKVGNLSSASVLFVLADTIRERPGRPGDFGLVIAMGPGFCSEMVLFQW